MTPFLKQLSYNYGQLFITLAELQRQRPGSSHTSLADYYATLGPALPGEPVLTVRVSKDREIRFLHSEEALSKTPAEHRQGAPTVWELPEDEFYFFKAFRETAYDLNSALPSFLFNMAFVYAYTLFESYVADIIRMRLSDPEATRLMREPIGSVLRKLRLTQGFEGLTDSFDQRVVQLSLLRNCLVHNENRVDPKLAAVQPSLQIGEPIEVNLDSVMNAIHVYRDLALELDSFVGADNQHGTPEV
jgi:hypothetical protein